MVSHHLTRTMCLSKRIVKQHIPKSITNPPTPHIRQSFPRPGKDTSPRQFHESAIGQHLLDNAQCALHYNKDKFSVLARARTPFHLSALEVTFIKSLNPLLCKQKEFVYSLKIKGGVVNGRGVTIKSQLFIQKTRYLSLITPWIGEIHSEFWIWLRAFY